MMTDTILRKTVMQYLIEEFGNIETEQFISLIIKEPICKRRCQAKNKRQSQNFHEAIRALPFVY
jgi:hypothetical protein